MKRILRSLGLVAACAVLWLSGPAAAQISANGQMDPAGVRPIARGNYTTFTATSASCPTMGRGVQQVGAGFVAAFSQGMGNATIDVEGTADTLSVVASMDGAHWVAVSKIYAMPYTGTSSSSITTTGQYAINAAGWMYVCVFDPSFANGPTVTLNTSPATFADITGGSSGSSGSSGWTLLATVTGGNTSADISAASLHEIQVYQAGASAPSGNNTLNSKTPDGTYRSIISATASTGSNTKMIMSLGPYANTAEANAITSMPVYTYTIPQTLQFVASSSGTYTVYGR